VAEPLAALRPRSVQLTVRSTPKAGNSTRKMANNPQSLDNLEEMEREMANHPVAKHVERLPT
jgi:hypothetical protein